MSNYLTCLKTYLSALIDKEVLKAFPMSKDTENFDCFGSKSLSAVNVYLP